MSDVIYNEQWGRDLAATLSPNVKSQVGRIRLGPPLIPIVPGKSKYEDVVQSFRVIPGQTQRINPSAKLAPIIISSAFRLEQQQFADETVASQLLMQPAMDLAFAEDVIILHGKRAAAVLKQKGLHITDENSTLDEQEGLFSGDVDPEPIVATKSIVDSVLDGIKQLRDNQQHGPYCVVVSTDLHTEAMTPIGDSGMARIAPILPQLRDNGFRYSEAAPVRTGVIFSLGGGAVDLPIPWDTHVEFRSLEGRAIFVVVEQFRLRINDPRAVVTLS